LFIRGREVLEGLKDVRISRWQILAFESQRFGFVGDALRGSPGNAKGIRQLGHGIEGEFV
jgi:hypothetical protein